MHRTIGFACALGLAVLGPAGADAAGLSYNYVEAGLRHIDIDNGGDGTGPRIAGSLAVTPDVHVFGGYSDVDLGTPDREDLTLGVGLNGRVATDLDAVLRLSYEDRDLDTPSGSRSNDGLALRLGGRTLLAPPLELNASLVRYELDDNDATGFSVGSVYSFTPRVGLAADFEYTDDESRIDLSGRLYF